MTYLAIIFASPVYFAMRKKWSAFVLNLALYLTALVLCMTIVLALGGVFLWMLAVGHAGWHLRREMMEQHARMIATSIAEQMAQSPRART